MHLEAGSVQHWHIYASHLRLKFLAHSKCLQLTLQVHYRGRQPTISVVHIHAPVCIASLHSLISALAPANKTAAFSLFDCPLV